ncbi:TldE-like protein [archaeon]|nr:TldE-like protein [archaeon]|tara:strand:+ start:1292 stop:2614 length:1323 start_codon:yes stop_codon:yes gene_type:complete
MKEKLAKYINKELVKKGASDVVVNVGEVDAKQVKFVNNEIVKTGVEFIDHLDVFANFKNKLVSTSLRDFSQAAADKLIKEILAFSKNIQKKDDYYGVAKGDFKYKNVKDLYDKKYDNIDMVDLTMKAINASLVNGKRSSGILESNKFKNYLLTSNNVEKEQEGTHFYLSLRSFYDKDSSGHKNVAGRMLKDFNVEYAGLKAGEIAKDSRKPKKGNPGKFDVILDPLASAPLLDNIGNSASIFSVESGTSFFMDKLNQKVANNNFTLYDDATYANGLNSSDFDGEGSPSQKTTVIKNGVLKSYLHNASTAKKYKTKSTGNAGLVSPDPSNIVLDNGSKSVESLIKDVKDGLYITNVWYTRFTNYATGDFSTIPRDGIFVIKNGEINGAVNNIRISENMLNILNNIKDRANDLQQIRSWEAEIPVIAPSILVKDMNITRPVL